MMDLKVMNTDGSDSGVISLDLNVFGREYNEALIHQVIKSYMSNARSANSKQKTRSEVAKSTKKPFRQKGTGNARAGMASSPLWRGGGRIFANTGMENYNQKINRKMYRAAILSILSQLIRDDRFNIVENLNIESPKTKNFINILKSMSLNEGTVLIIINELTEELYLASRNLANVLVLESHQVDPYSLLRCDKVLISRDALNSMQEQLA
jgi:large subunit ribosomal protein L4